MTRKVMLFGYEIGRATPEKNGKNGKARKNGKNGKNGTGSKGSTGDRSSKSSKRNGSKSGADGKAASRKSRRDGDRPRRDPAGSPSRKQSGRPERKQTGRPGQRNARTGRPGRRTGTQNAQSRKQNTRPRTRNARTGKQDTPTGRGHRTPAETAPAAGAGTASGTAPAAASGSARSRPRPAVRVLVMVLAFAAMVAFAVVLARLTLVPSPASESLTHSNLRPGDSIRTYLAQPAFRDTVKQIGGNIVLGVPFGLLLPVLLPRARGLLRVGAATALVMVLVELVQGALVTGRAFDIDDVVLNTGGALLGYLLLGRRMGRAVHPRRTHWWHRFTRRQPAD